MYTLFYAFPATLLAISIHEASHAYVSYLCGDRQVKASGRISLNPFRHLDLVGTLCLLIFHFGWAKPVVVDTRDYKHKRLDFCLVALAGPISNFLLAILSAFLEVLVYYKMTPSIPKEIIFNLLLYSTVINIGLGVFNLIPVPPLDGSNVLLSFLPRSASQFVARNRKYAGIAMLVLLIILSTPIGNFLTYFNDQIYQALISTFSKPFLISALPAAV